VSKEEFDSYISNGIILWGQSVTDVLEEGQLRIRQTIKSEMTPLVSILIEGNFRTKKHKSNSCFSGQGSNQRKRVWWKT
jgi:hypothetical protein